MPNKFKFTVEEQYSQIRADKYFNEKISDLTRTFIQKLINEGNAWCNGKTLDKNKKVNEGDILEILVPDAEPYNAQPEYIPLDIIYEDDDLLVVNKPQGMVVHPAAGNYSGTLVNALLSHCGGSLSGINGVMRPGIVHRIDKDTSGLLIVAKNDLSHKSLAEQIKAHSFTRCYEAVVCGNLKNESGFVEAPIGRHPTNRKRMAVTMKNSKDAKTFYEVLKFYQGFTHIRLKLETGRTHQIRVHMAYLGHSVAGDPVYGKQSKGNLKGQCLHAKEIGFIHPKTGEYMHFSSALPNYFTDFLNFIT